MKITNRKPKKKSRTNSYLSTVLMILMMGFIPYMNAQEIATLAGDAHYIGDGKLPDHAILKGPQRMAWDQEGNMYIAEIWGSRIRKIDAKTGLISTFIGNGVKGYTGDGEHYSNAQIGRPGGIAFDDDGNFYFGDETYHTVRKVDAETGIVTTIAGIKDAAGSYDGPDPGNSPATEATFNVPIGIATKGDTVYVCGFQDHKVRELRPDADNPGQYLLKTMAGTGSANHSGDGGPAVDAQLKKPQDLAFNSDKTELYIGGNNTVRKINLKDGNIYLVAGDEFYWDYIDGEGGPANEAIIGWVQGVALDSEDNVYIACRKAGTLRKIDAATGKIYTLGKTMSIGSGKKMGTPGFSGDGGNAKNAKYSQLWGVDVDSADNVYISDIYHSRIRKINHENSVISTFAGGYSGDGGAPMDAYIKPLYIEKGTSGELYVSDMENHTIRKISASGIISRFAGVGGGWGFSGDGGPAKKAELDGPRGIAVNADGEVVFAVQNNHRVRKVDTDGNISTIAGSDEIGFGGDGGAATSAMLYSPVGVALDDDGNLYIADMENHRIRKVDTDGNISTIAGTGEAGDSGDGAAAIDAQLNLPTGLEYADGKLYVADNENSRIRVIDLATGTISNYAGNGDVGFDGDEGISLLATMGKPQGLFIDANGRGYIADTENHRIRTVAPQAEGFTINTMIGSGTEIPSGGFENVNDGSDLLAANLNKPYDIFVDNNYKYIADHENFRIRITGTSNSAPVVEQTIEDQETKALVEWTLNVVNTFSDDDPGDFVAYSASLANGNILPNWLNFNATAYTFTGTPEATGTLNIILKGRDKFANEVTEAFTLTIAPPPPKILYPLADTTFEEGFGTVTVRIDTLFMDPQGGDLTFAGVSESEDIVTASVTDSILTITEAGVGTANIIVTATNDNSDETDMTFTFTVNASGNTVPQVINDIEEQEAEENKAFSFTIPDTIFVDHDEGDVLSYSAKYKDGSELTGTWLEFNPETKTFSGTPTGDDIGIVNILVTVTDGSGTSASTEFSITIAKGVAIYSYKENQPLLIYPNPVKTRLYIDLKSSTKDHVKIQIIDAAGRLVHVHTTCNHHHCMINCDNMQNGLYNILVYMKDNLYTARFIKE